LHYDGRVKLLGWAFMAMSTPMVAFFLYGALHAPANQVPLVLTALAVFLSLPLILILEFHRVTIAFDGTSIYCQSPWRRSRVVPWADVKSVKYSPWARWYVAKTTAHGSIRLNNILSGLDEFLAESERRGVALPYWPQPSALGRYVGRHLDLRTRLLWTHAPVALFAAAISLYFFWIVAEFVVKGSFASQTRLNLGHPIEVQFPDDPLLFIALTLGHSALGGFAGGWCVESSYHVVRLLYPSLGWPLHLQFRPFRVGYLLFISAVVAWGCYFGVKLLMGRQ